MAGFSGGFKMSVDQVTLKATDDQYVEILMHANDAALQARAANEDDGGTCNFDSPVLFFPKGTRSERVQRIAKSAGIDLDVRRWLGRTCYSVGTAASGQGALRTRMAEAAYRSMKDAGLDVMMYYQMD